jgi:hypothetical protein
MTQAKVLPYHPTGGPGKSHEIPVRVVGAPTRLSKLPPAGYDSDALQLRPTCSVPISVPTRASAYASTAPSIRRTPEASTGSQVAKATCYSVLFWGSGFLLLHLFRDHITFVFDGTGEKRSTSKTAGAASWSVTFINSYH